MFRSPIEKEMLSMYTEMYLSMGFPYSEAKSMCESALEAVKQESKEEGMDNLPDNFGSILIKKENEGGEIKRVLTKARKEGARTEDILWWWNLNDLERRMMNFIDNTFRMQSFTKDIEKGLSEEEATIQTRKYFPIYGDPDNTSNTTGDDRPLPFELKDRVNIYIEKRKNDTASYKSEIEKTSTLNALIRKEIRNGNL